jgi:cell division septation protein DedD
VGLPQLDFRVPEATWFKSVLAGRFGAMPGLNGTGALAWPYKIAVVAVMALVASGTLVTFGSAGAETPSSAEVSALPGSDEASPTVEGQVMPNTGLLNSADLMSSLNLTDYSPDGTLDLSLFDDEDGDDSDEDSDDSDEDTTTASSTPTPTSNPTTSPTTSAPSTKPTTASPTTAPPTSEPEPECHNEMVWIPASGSLREGNLKLGHFEPQEVCD